MLLGRTAQWVLKPPFTKHGSNGLYGEIVAAGFMQDLVAKGQDVLTNTYTPVGGESLYKEDLKENLIVVTIDVSGKYYMIPDKYIENLYEGDRHFKWHYLTARVGLLPKDYDMSEAVKVMADAIKDATGVDVKPADIMVSVSDQAGQILTAKQGVVEDLKRAARIENNDSAANKVRKAEKEKNKWKKYAGDISKAFKKHSDKLGIDNSKLDFLDKI